MEKISVIGLGYVGLPLALALSRNFPDTIGFDVNTDRVESLKQGIDQNGEVSQDTLKSSILKITSDPQDLNSTSFFVTSIPTPVDSSFRPDLQYLRSASELVGKFLKQGTVVVYESTVYPGATENYCGKILAEVSGLRQGVDFKLGYSPERINIGDTNHTIEKIVKIVSGEDEKTLERIARVYSTIIEAGIYRAPSIKVAESAKLVENIQRDVNIALMNELALIFDRLGINTVDVLFAAKTKWNFLPFTPGLVGGNCISVDPYYLVELAEAKGYNPQVILASRRTNNSVGDYLAQKLIELLSKHQEIPLKQSRVGILGVTFKENVRDISNSLVPQIVKKLQDFGIHPLVHDPLADAQVAWQEYGIALAGWQDLCNLDAMILAVRHQAYLDMTSEQLLAGLRSGGILMDIKSALDP